MQLFHYGSKEVRCDREIVEVVAVRAVIDVELLQQIFELLKCSLVAKFAGYVIHSSLKPLLEVWFKLNVGELLQILFELSSKVFGRHGVPRYTNHSEFTRQKTMLP